MIAFKNKGGGNPSCTGSINIGSGSIGQNGGGTFKSFSSKYRSGFGPEKNVKMHEQLASTGN